MNRPIIQPHAPIFDRPETLEKRDYNVVDGKYDYAKNMLILDVEVLDTLRDGSQKTRIEKRGFEITSLKVRTAKVADPSESLPNPVEILGARTNEAIERILPFLIRNLNQNVNKEIFFSTSPNGKLTKKTIQFAQQFQALEEGSQPSSLRVVSATSSTKSDYLGDSQDLEGYDEEISKSLHHTDSSNSVQNIKALRMLLDYSHFESMLKEQAEQTEPSLDPLVDLSEVPICKHPRIAQFAQTLAKTDFLLEAGQKKPELENLYQNMQTALEHLDSQIMQIDEFIEKNQYILIYDALVLLKAHRNGVLQLKYQYEAEHQKITLAQNLFQDLTLLNTLYGSDAVSLSLFGKAPMSAYLAKELNAVMMEYKIGLLEGEDLEASLKDKLGLNLEPEQEPLYELIEKDVAQAFEEISKETVKRIRYELDELFEQTQNLYPLASQHALEGQLDDLTHRISLRKEHFLNLALKLDENELLTKDLDYQDMTIFFVDGRAKLIRLEDQIRRLEEERREVPFQRRDSTSSRSTLDSPFEDFDRQTLPSDEELLRRLNALRQDSDRAETPFATPPQTPSEMQNSLFEEDPLDSLSDVDSFWDKLAAKRKKQTMPTTLSFSSEESDLDEEVAKQSFSQRKKSVDQIRSERRAYERKKLPARDEDLNASYDQAKHAARHLPKELQRALGLEESSGSEDEES